MKRFGTLWGAALAMTLGLCLLIAPRAAHAQVDQGEELSRDWNVRIGMYILQSQTSRGVAGEVGISGIVERTVYHGNMYDVNVGIGYNGFDKVYSIPIMVEGIYHKHNLRLGGGAGYAFNKRLDGSGSNGTAINLILGYQFLPGKTPMNVDLRYYFIGGSSDELSGYSLTLGVKF